jgi:hypothetical protein
MKKLFKAIGLSAFMASAACAGFSFGGREARAANCHNCVYNDATAIWFCPGLASSGWAGCRLHGNPAGSLGCDNVGFVQCVD